MTPEYRSREFHDDRYLPGDECPIDHEDGVSPGEAISAHERSGGVCEAHQLCRRPVTFVVLDWRGDAQAVCEIHR